MTEQSWTIAILWPHLVDFEGLAIHMVLAMGTNIVTVWIFLWPEGLKGDNNTDNGTYKTLFKFDYIHLVWSVCAEFPGQLLP